MIEPIKRAKIKMVLKAQTINFAERMKRGMGRPRFRHSGRQHICPPLLFLVIPPLALAIPHTKTTKANIPNGKCI